MKTIGCAALSLLMCFALADTSLAFVKAGAVLCDANLNSQIDSADVGVPGVLVVVTNTSGTFSNANWTQPDGTFVIGLSTTTDSYVEFIQPGTLPPGTQLISPTLASFQTVGDQPTVTNNFLVRNLSCLPAPFVSTGSVFCDANTNNVFDAGDLPLAGVGVAAVNASGSFSNAVVTDPEGHFLLPFPAADTYFVFLTDTQNVVLVPAGGVSQVAVSAEQPVNTSDFIVDCGAAASTNRCWLTGSGAIRAGKTIIHSFSGIVYPGCRSNLFHGGVWTDVFRAAKLQFQARSIQVVNCGNVLDETLGSATAPKPFNFIEFQGVGRLKGTGSHRADFGLVFFFARAEDFGRPGRSLDRYYLRIEDVEGNVLLVISANPTNPLEVAPVPVSSGNLEIHTLGCNRPSLARGRVR